MDTNKGCGLGRNIGFAEASGKYIFFLDDDAIIADDSKYCFFLAAINYMDSNPLVATLTTRISDVAWKRDRSPRTSKRQNKLDIFMLMFGAVFIRKECYTEFLCLNIKYGYEELAPSLYARENGYHNIYFDKVRIIHNPQIDKWSAIGSENRNILIRECAAPYATKLLIYPIYVYPVIRILFNIRCRKYLRKYSGAYKETQDLVELILRNNSCAKISLRTLVDLYRDFGVCVF